MARVLAGFDGICEVVLSTERGEKMLRKRNQSAGRHGRCCRQMPPVLSLMMLQQTFRAFNRFAANVLNSIDRISCPTLCYTKKTLDRSSRETVESCFQNEWVHCCMSTFKKASSKMDSRQQKHQKQFACAQFGI